MDTESLARELLEAYDARQTIAVAPSAREGGLSLDGAYAVEAAIAGRRRASGRKTVGVKVGFANKAMWRALKLETLVWAHMYDDTVRHAATNEAVLTRASMVAPKVEPEIVFRLKRPLGHGLDAAAALDAVEWMALGFEIIDCVFADWKFQPVDFVASKGLHAALVVGEPHAVTADEIPALVEQLPVFSVKLMNAGNVVAEGSGKNVLRSPALCLAELGAAMAARAGAEPPGAGPLVSSGTLTESQFLSPGQTWTAEVQGLPLPPLRLRVD